MSEHIKGFTVTLEDDIREESAKNIASLIGCISGVISVEPMKSDPMGQMVAARVRIQVVTKLLELLK